MDYSIEQIDKIIEYIEDVVSFNVDPDDYEILLPLISQKLYTRYCKKKGIK